MNIAQSLQRLLTSSGISRSKLAREIGVHTSTVSNWLDGKEVKAENLSALCAYFGCSLDYLAGQTVQAEKAPSENGEGKVDEADLKAAFWGGEKDLSPEELDEMWEDVKEYARYKMEQRRRKNDKPSGAL